MNNIPFGLNVCVCVHVRACFIQIGKQSGITYNKTNNSGHHKGESVDLWII